LANSPQAIKRARQNIKRNHLKASQRSTMRTTIKKVRRLISAGDQQKAQEAFLQAMPVIDCFADKDIIHKNAAARYKSRLNRAIRSMNGSETGS